MLFITNTISNTNGAVRGSGNGLPNATAFVGSLSLVESWGTSRHGGWRKKFFDLENYRVRWGKPKGWARAQTPYTNTVLYRLKTEQVTYLQPPE